MSSSTDSKPTPTNRRAEEDSDDLHVDLDDGASAQGGEADEEAEAAELAAMKARGESSRLRVWLAPGTTS